MKTNKIAATLAVALTLGTLVASATAQAQWTDDRQATQRARIHDGLSSGTLTRKEAQRLRKGQRRIARLEERLGADGRYSRHDRRKLGRALDRASKRIYRAKHNGRDRRNGGHPGHARHGHGHGAVTEIHNHYETAAPEPEIIESSPVVNRSFEVDFDGVRVIWSASGLL